MSKKKSILYKSEIVSLFPKIMRQTLHDPPCPWTGRGFHLQEHTVHKQYKYTYVDCKISFSGAGKRTLGVKKFASHSHADIIIACYPPLQCTYVPYCQARIVGQPQVLTKKDWIIHDTVSEGPNGRLWVCIHYI